MKHSEITIEIIYALSTPQTAGQTIKSYRLTDGATVRDALAASRLSAEFAGVQINESALARYGKIISLEDRLSDGDRIEILRPLIVDAKESRRRRAAIQALRKK